MMEDTRPWQGADCPERGPALSHTNSASGKCRHCGVALTTEKPEPKPDEPEAKSEMVDHQYAFTVAGKCAICGQTTDVHPRYLTDQPEGACVVDHKSIVTKMGVGNFGLQWSRCPNCEQMVEPKMAMGEPHGNPDGVGRGWLSPRTQRKLTDISKRIESGALVP